MVAIALRHRQRGGHYAGTRVDDRRRMAVIGFVGMSECAIDQRGIDRRGRDTRADDARFGGSAERLDVGDRALAGQQARA